MTTTAQLMEQIKHTARWGYAWPEPIPLCF
jgi:hypothetical protein